MKIATVCTGPYSSVIKPDHFAQKMCANARAQARLPDLFQKQRRVDDTNNPLGKFFHHWIQYLFSPTFSPTHTIATINISMSCRLLSSLAAAKAASSSSSSRSSTTTTLLTAAAVRAPRSFFSTTTTRTTRNVVIVSGVRLPFATTSSGLYKDELAVDLQRLALQGLFTETALPKDQVDYVICGNVIQEVRTSNLAREAAINAGIPVHIGAHTIAQVRNKQHTTRVVVVVKSTTFVRVCLSCVLGSKRLHIEG